MDVKEKLTELLDDMQRSGTGYFGSAIENKKIADYLITHDVTIQESDGCDFCKKFDFAGARAEVNKYGAYISLAICNTKFSDDERFKFCPMCGRRLPRPPKGE